MALKSLYRWTNPCFLNFARRTFSNQPNYEVDESRAKVLIETEELEPILGQENVKILNSTWYYDNSLDS